MSDESYADLLGLVKSKKFRERVKRLTNRMTLVVEFNDGRLISARFSDEMRVGHDIQRAEIQEAAQAKPCN